MILRVLIIVILVTFPTDAFAQRRKAKRQAKRPEPTVANFAYGNDSDRQVLDFWQAEADEPTPVLVLIHGGGWRAGDKSA
jgi:acetyl esterase/lipase